jgi:hypothetical protein
LHFAFNIQVLQISAVQSYESLPELCKALIGIREESIEFSGSVIEEIEKIGNFLAGTTIYNAFFNVQICT